MVLLYANLFGQALYSRAGRSMETEFVLRSPSFKYFLAPGCYIGRLFLPESRWRL